MIKILSSLVAFFSITSLCAQNVAAEVPKLVVGITIDQLRGDYLEMFKHTFGEKGFKRLLNSGLVYANVSYDFPAIDRASAMTTLYTGANPSYHGIIAENKFAVDLNRETASFSDDKYLGNYTTEKLSPLPVKVSTLTDELQIASGGQSDVFAFAPHASQALASGGHAATGAYWIEDFSGKWATTTFYKNKQPVVDQRNRGIESTSNRINSITWRPAIDVNQYNAFPYTKNIYNFQHFFANDKKNSVKLFKQSPYVNTEVREIAEAVLRSNSLGKRMNPDFLAVTFYAGNYENALDKNYSVEIQDTYYRLDQELGKLLDAIEETVGIKNALIFVVSTGYFNEQEILPQGMVTSNGIFRPERTQALLNMYLMAVYGREQWIKKYYNRQFFFDRKLIEDKKISLADFQKTAAEFLVLSAGVQDVYTSYQMLHGAYNGVLQHYRNGYYKNISGDLFLELQPGWHVEDSQNGDHQFMRNNAVLSPVFFLGNHIKPQKIEQTIDALQIAPSVAYRLRIRAPNAAKGSILKELL
ncbi:MAG TPA: alkaline phosphatase family protein [Porphyromonadaceae bacterium]|jgi:predicted AlkP superfamily pyrophosphatase or phosphodiesterase|uniref:alkaline phosphatase family protein n=1 Tax=Limibacterium fermenti TaxID=3229863 RepID=UPI000E96C3B5|nr:alkaline phosphatase family protein [Porphyromonadaceae bacterium]HBL33110.1 alkaline phosphatase family protein [Porphyromonadaceae bacterium]HBX44891.1 alkaline phosphatase family protein [Porphyromonadaceae bacterium]HCM19627.1 alkaline phosphatase family protein [Porphyromonadaceae bacterium]